jgi:hypothetical protein
MAEQGGILSEVTLEDLQDLMSQGFMMTVEVATSNESKEPASPMPGGDMWWPTRHSTSEGLVCQHIDFSTLTIVLWPRTTPLDPLRDLAHSGLWDLVRGLHGD